MNTRPRFDVQIELDFSPSNLKVTNEYYAKYECISQILNDNPEIVESVHKDLLRAFGGKRIGKGGRDCGFSSDTILRMLLVKQIEGLKYREAVIRIDDSHFLRGFVGVLNGKMMDYSTLCKMFKKIRPATWKRINDLLTAYAVETEQIDGEMLRRDSTVYEANIHYPTDSSLLWDTYRVLARFIDNVREVAPELVGEQRLRTKDVKRIYFQINRKSSRRSEASKKQLKTLYGGLLRHVEKILQWSDEVCARIADTCADYTAEEDAYLLMLAKDYKSYIPLGHQVVDQATRRVVEGESVPNTEKIFSIFEPHVELIKRGKAGKDIEFGHLVNLQQVSQKFITGYDVFDTRPVEHQLVDPSLQRHVETFGEYPEVYADDKGAYESMEKLYQLEEDIPVVAIGKKGNRNDEEWEREHQSEFKIGQKFRAGIEGTISFLKRFFGMGKCMYKGLMSFKASVGSMVFSHNLLILARE